MAYIGYNGVKYETGIQIGKGGEGSIFKVLNHPDYILKIYHPAQRTKYKQNKIQAMLSYPITAKLLQVANWPIDIVYDEHGFAGCLLRYYDHIVSLHEILSNSESLSVSDKLLIAKNICYAVSTLHETNLVYGDFNPWNIGINIQSGHVILLDIDSFHLVDEKNEYRCVVGVPEYIAPEVLRKTQNGLTLSSAPLPTFTVESDRFTLAVHIFTLLMNNCHPFACAIDLSQQKKSIPAPQPIDSILDGFFPFVQHKSGLSIPAYAPDFAYLPCEIQLLFKRAFIDGFSKPSLRPYAEEWFYALENMKSDLIICSINAFHAYPPHNTGCPWCKLKFREAVMAQFNKVSMKQYLSNRIVDTIDHNTKMACVMLIDLSISMQGEPLEQASKIVSQVLCDMGRVELAERLNITIIGFNDTVTIIKPYFPLERFKNSETLSFEASNKEANIDIAIEKALKSIAAHNKFYNGLGIGTYPATILTLSNGVVLNGLDSAISKIKKATYEYQKETSWMIGVPPSPYRFFAITCSSFFQSSESYNNLQALCGDKNRIYFTDTDNCNCYDMVKDIYDLHSISVVGTS